LIQTLREHEDKEKKKELRKQYNIVEEEEEEETTQAGITVDSLLSLKKPRNFVRVFLSVVS